MSDEKDEAAPMIELTDLTKVYGHGDGRTVVLDRVNFRVDAGEILAVVGPSGAGKSTLAQCINLLTPPTSGSVVVNGEDLTTLAARQRNRDLRRSRRPTRPARCQGGRRQRAHRLRRVRATVARGD